MAKERCCNKSFTYKDSVLGLYRSDRENVDPPEDDRMNIETEENKDLLKQEDDQPLETE